MVHLVINKQEAVMSAVEVLNVNGSILGVMPL